jgi:hypothetical protein
MSNDKLIVNDVVVAYYKGQSKTFVRIIGPRSENRSLGQDLNP